MITIISPGSRVCPTAESIASHPDLAGRTGIVDSVIEDVARVIWAGGVGISRLRVGELCLDNMPKK